MKQQLKILIKCEEYPHSIYFCIGNIIPFLKSEYPDYFTLEQLQFFFKKEKASAFLEMGNGDLIVWTDHLNLQSDSQMEAIAKIFKDIIDIIIKQTQVSLSLDQIFSLVNDMVDQIRIAFIEMVKRDKPSLN